MSIDGKYAQLQKLSSNFQSRRYSVNLTNLYPAGNNSSLEFHARSIDSNSSSESEYEITNNTPAQVDLEQPSSSVQERDPPHFQDDNTNNDMERFHRRPHRQRQQPAWMRSGNYELQDI